MSMAVPHRASSVGLEADTMGEQVRALLRTSQRDQKLFERRQHQRHPLPVLMTLYSDESPETPPQVIVGRDISERGLGFYHSQPISFRAGIVVCDLPDGGQTAFEIDITWCRFARQGWYESGCRLLRVVPPPVILPEVANAS